MSSRLSSPKTKPNNSREVLALNLIAYRRQRGWSQEVLAFEAGLHRTFIAHVERMARNISLDNLDKLADALGVLTEELIKSRADIR